MANALNTLHRLRRATAQVALRQTAMLFVKGSLAPHEAALGSWWQWWRSTAYGRTLTHWRSGSTADWRSLSQDGHELGWLAMFPAAPNETAPRWLELADRPDPGCDASSVVLSIYDLPSAMGVPRASLICLRLPDDATPATFTQFGEASMQQLPVWWGTAGWAYQYESGRPDVAARRTAALARRYWCVQILDATSLQWDALRGMPGINWLSWIGTEFAAQQGTTLEALAAAAAGKIGESIYHRLSPNGLSIAAGAKPLKGDINMAEDFKAYARAAELLQPLVLGAMTPLAGPLSEPKVLDAWLHRFDQPQNWLDVDTSTD